MCTRTSVGRYSLKYGRTVWVCVREIERKVIEIIIRGEGRTESGHKERIYNTTTLVRKSGFSKILSMHNKVKLVHHMLASAQNQ